MADKDRPLIAITMGDPAGIGPEVVIKALSLKEIYDICRPLLIGESNVTQKAIDLIQKPLKLHAITEIAETLGQFGTIDILDLHKPDPKDFKIGQISAACGGASMEYIEKAMQMALSGEVRAMVTAPINKEATMLAGYEGLGHLEYISKLTGTKESATMLATGNLRCVHLTTHHSLREACTLVTKERVLARLKLTDESFVKWGFGKPRIAAAGINPHAGENGMFGMEEIEEIAPAVAEAQKLGINVKGPIPADSVFNRAINGEFDVVLAMYHDQGHIPIKVHGFESSVSVALGLPLLRTSVDHGTAYDIAGKGIADAQSMAEAIKVAVSLCQGKGIQG
ncbi:MAG: 4-hydroxythreonine-4-phosphate dehydrogenase PdxA [Chloroflexota bacterium]